MINKIMDNLDFTSNKVEFDNGSVYYQKDGTYYRNNMPLPRRHIVQEVIIDLGEKAKYTIYGNEKVYKKEVIDERRKPIKRL